MKELEIISPAVVIAATSVDTDQIMPARYLSRLEKTGYDDALFHDWRRDPAFPLNEPRARERAILIAGRDFGIGSSREHAVWGLLDWGFRVVVSSAFGDIFMTNAGECGLLCAVVAQRDLERMMTVTAQDESVEFTVSVPRERISWADQEVGFSATARAKRLLMSGGDAIAQTLQAEDIIAGFETGRSSLKPTTRGL